MKLIGIFADQPLVECIGWALLHFLWQGLLIAILLKICLFALRNGSARQRYNAACVALLLMSLCPVVPIALLRSRSRATDANSVQAPRPTSTAEPIEFAPVASSRPSSDLKPAAANRSPISIKRILPYLVALWLAAVFALLFRLLGAWALVRRLIAQGTRPAPEPALASLRALAARMKIRRLPRLLESSHVQTPLAIGGLRAVILLPASMVTGLSTPLLESLLVHELAHLQRHDYLVNLWQMTLETILFYHPALWWVSQRIRIEREHCCDDAVEAILHDRLTYARALMTLEETRAQTPALAACDGELLARIRRILSGEATMATKGSSAAVVLAIVLALLVGVPIVFAAQAGQTVPSGQESLVAPKHVWMRAIRIKMNEQNTPLDVALAKVFQQTPFDYIYADNDSSLDMENFGCAGPLNFTLDAMKRIANIAWGVNRNIVFAQQESGKDDVTISRKYSARIRMTPLAAALEALQAVRPFRYRLEGKANPTVVEAMFVKLNFDEAVAKILARCETPMKFTRSGDTLIIVPAPTLPRPKTAGVEPAPIIEEGTPPPLAPGRIQVDAHGAFDSVLADVFHGAGKRYRISPTVTESEQAITVEKYDINFDEALTELLTMAPGQDRPLTYRIENGIYVIEPKGVETKPGEIVFAAIPGDMAARSAYTIDNRRIGEACRTIMDTAKESYLLCLPTSEKKISLKLKNATVEQALRAVLREADLGRQFRIARDLGVVYLLPSYDPSTAGWDGSYSGRFTDTSAWDLFGLVSMIVGNYQGDDGLKTRHVTVRFEDRSLDQMLSDIKGVASPGIGVDFVGNVLTVTSK